MPAVEPLVAAAAPQSNGRAFVRDALAEERLTLRATEHFFSETLGEFGIFFVAATVGVFVACTLPYLLDFFLATCRVPRNRRYQATQLAKGALLALTLYWALALVGVSLGTVLVASSIFSLPITFALQPLLVPYFAGFWLQATTIFELHHRVRINDLDVVIISLGTFAVEGRLYFDASENGRGAAADVQRGERPGERPDAGTDEAGVRYADKTVFIPNDEVLKAVVVAWWRAPRSNERHHTSGTNTRMW